MKNAIILLFALMSSTSIAIAQDSLQVQPSPALPQGQYGTPGEKPAEKEDRIAVKESEIPETMKETLERDKKYKGWQDGQIYFDRSNDQYLVHIVDSNATRTYRFDKRGVAIITGDSGNDIKENRN